MPLSGLICVHDPFDAKFCIFLEYHVAKYTWHGLLNYMLNTTERNFFQATASSNQWRQYSCVEIDSRNFAHEKSHQAQVAPENKRIINICNVYWEREAGTFRNRR